MSDAVGSISHILKTAFKDVYADEDRRKEENVEAGSDGGQEESSVNDTAEAPVDEGDSEESTDDEASSTEEE